METVEALQPAPTQLRTPRAPRRTAPARTIPSASEHRRLGAWSRKLIHFAAHLLRPKSNPRSNQVERMHRAAQDKADRAAELGDTVERLRRTVARLEAEREAQAELSKNCGRMRLRCVSRRRHAGRSERPAQARRRARANSRRRACSCAPRAAPRHEKAVAGALRLNAGAPGGA